MKHNHDADVNINVNLPKEDMEELIDKTTNAAVTIIAALTLSHVVKAIFTPKTT